MKNIVLLTIAMLVLASCSKSISHRYFKENEVGGEQGVLVELGKDYYAQEDGRIIIQEDHNIGTSAPNSFNVDLANSNEGI